MKTLLLSVLMSVLAFASVSQAQSAATKTKPKIVAISVTKSARMLSLIDDKYRVYKTYNVSLGSEPIGNKVQEGDGKTPEGKYKIGYKNPNSEFYLSLQVSYPNSNDKKIARERGVDPGSNIMIHGIGKEFGWVGAAHTLFDWTQGCIAVTNEEMREIYSLVNVGTLIYIWP